MFCGGQTVTFGRMILFIGKVSIVVLIGLSDQPLNDSLIKRDAPTNELMTIHIQNTLINPLDEEMYETP